MSGFNAFPTEFPAAAAARIGNAIIGKAVTADLIEPAYDLLGYVLGRIFGTSSEVKPTFGGGLHTDEDLAALLVSAAESGPGFAASGEDGLEAIPWTLVLPLLLKLIGRFVK